MSNCESPKIAVVDDNEELRVAIEKSLSSQGFSVSCYNCGEDALKAIKESRFDLIFSDVDMPHGTGLWLVEQLRSGGDNTPLVLMSGGHPELSETALDLGANAFIEKPFRVHVILDAVKKFGPKKVA